MANHDDASTANGPKQKEGKGRAHSKERNSSKREDYDEDPIKTRKEQEDKSLLLGDIIFTDGNRKNGKVRLGKDQMPHFKSMWTEQRRQRKVPYKVDILTLRLRALQSMNRMDKRHMLRELAEKGEKCIKVEGINGRDLPEKFGIKRRVSLATVLILYVGLHIKEKYTAVHPEALFAELVGCADVDTMKDLSYYLCPPLMTLEKLPHFIHCAVRQIARSESENRSHEPVALAIQTVNAISAVLEQLNAEKKGKKENKEKEKKKEKKEKLAKLKSLMERTLARARPDQAEKTKGRARKKYFSRDLGCHAGLLLAGVQRYIYKAQGNSSRKKELCDLFIDASSGLLTGIPLCGFLFGPLGSVVKHSAHSWYFNREADRIDQLSQGVRQHFDEFIAAPIFFNGEFKEKEKEVEEVEWEEFSKWYNQVISWNEMQNELRELKKNGKQEPKKKLWFRKR